MIITIEASINKPLEKVWEVLTEPKHIINWNFASDDWCCPNAENNLVVGEKYIYRMEAKDGSFGFDFGGTYTAIEVQNKVYSVLGDGRSLEIDLKFENGQTIIIERFEAEGQNSPELQKQGWQSILNNLKKYAESL